MTDFFITLQHEGIVISAKPGQTLQQALLAAGIQSEAPCGGKGTCGKCRCEADGKEVLACQTVVEHDMTLRLPEREQTSILTRGVSMQITPDADTDYVLAIDIGTTTVVAYLLHGHTGAVLQTCSMLNPQTAYGGDVINRIQYVLEHPGTDALRSAILGCLDALTKEAASREGISPLDIARGCIVGNTAMHHLLLGIDPKPLTVPPYMPTEFVRLELPAAGLLPINPDGTVRILPNIAGFVGADTVGCMAAVDFDCLKQTTLMIDIGTNGEMVITDGIRRIACSTAAGPAFEGAKIRYGMRGAPGAIDHVDLKNGTLSCSVIGNGTAKGICGSGLLDAVWAMLQCGMIDETGRMNEDEGESWRWGTTDGHPAVRLQDDIWLTQRDVRELQLAKAAIRAGIELLMKKLSITAEQVQQVLLAGAFGNFLRPASACGVGLLPPMLEARIVPIGNAAGVGAQRCALRRADFEHTAALAEETEFLELASMPEFQDCFVDGMSFEEEGDLE